MKILVLSDTHSRIKDIFNSWSVEDKKKSMECDFLIHSGDISSHGTRDQLENELSWMNDNFKMDKIVIGGNHDFYLDTNWKPYTPVGRRRFSSKKFGTKKDINDLMNDHNISYLNDSFIIKDGIKIWGSPITPWFHDWAFNRNRGGYIDKHWNMIPNDVDILITHGPPRGILDLLSINNRRDGELPNVGCDHLLSKIQEVKPKIHIFGHIHESRGMFESDGTFFINASSLGENYEPTGPPIIFNYGN